MTSLGEYRSALQMRDIVERLTRNIIDTERPVYRYGIVQSIDRPNRKADVRFQGESLDISVNMGSIQPNAVGQVVRVGGLGGDKFIEDVMGVPYTPLDNLSDVEILTEPADNSALFYDTTTDLWKPKPAVLDNLSDVEITTEPVDKSLLSYDTVSDTWKPKPLNNFGRLVGYSQKTAIIAQTAAEFNAGTVTLTLRAGYVYLIRWSGILNPNTIGMFTTMNFKYGVGASVGGTFFARGYQDHRAVGRLITANAETVLPWAAADLTCNIVITLLGGGGSVGLNADTGTTYGPSNLIVFEYPAP